MPDDPDSPPSFEEDELGEILERYRAATEAEDGDAAAEAAEEVFAFVTEEYADNPPEHLRLALRAGECEQSLDWDGAEEAYLSILAIEGVDDATSCRAHIDLSGLFGILNKRSEAVRHSHLATDLARRSNSNFVLAFALKSQAWCLFRHDHGREAAEVVTELESLLRTDPMWDQMHAGAFVLRARCAIRAGRFKQAKTSLNAAFDRLEPAARVVDGAGLQQDLALYWLVRAELYEAEQNQLAAIQAWREAVDRAKHMSALWDPGDPHTESFIARMLKGLAGALASRGLMAEAETAAAEGQQILEKIGLPDKN